MILGVSAGRWPECRLGCAGSGLVGRAGRAGRSGWRWQRADSGEDFREEVVSWREAQGMRAGVADQAGGHREQSVPQGGDHGLAAADAVAAKSAVRGGGGGELV